MREPGHTSTLQASACITFAHIPLSRAASEVRLGGHYNVTRGYEGGWRVGATVVIYQSSELTDPFLILIFS